MHTPTLAQWCLERDRTSSWVRFMHGVYYVRFCEFPRTINGRIAKRIVEIANVTVADEYRGQGEFHSAMHYLCSHLEFDLLRIENVMNTRLARRLEREGWEAHSYSEYDFVSYVKPPEQHL